jgi:hypothetical protein
VALAAAASAALLWRARRTPTLAPEPEASGATVGRAERTFFAAVLAVTCLALFHEALAASLSVIHENDEANFWAMRAKVLFDVGFGPQYRSAIETNAFYNSNYPLLDSLLQLWTFDCAGAITHVANRFPLQLSTLALVLCSAAAFRRFCRPGLAALFVILLASTAPVGMAIRQANADVLVALGALVAADAFARAVRTRARAWVGLVSLASAFQLASKREGPALFFGCLLALAPTAWQQRAAIRAEILRLVRASTPLLWLLPPALVLIGTRVHNLVFGASGSHDLGLGLVAELRTGIGQLPSTLAFLAEMFTRPSMCAIPAAFTVLALLAPFSRWRPRNPLAFVPLACLVFVLGLLAAILRGNADYLLHTASQRVLFQILPLELLWIATLAPTLLASAFSSQASVRESLENSLENGERA